MFHLYSTYTPLYVCMQCVNIYIYDFLSRNHDLLAPCHSPRRFRATAGRRSWPLPATTSSSSTSTAAPQAPRAAGD